MPEDNTLNDTLAQALKLLDGDSVVAPEPVVVPEVVPPVVAEVVPEVTPEVWKAVPKEEPPVETPEIIPELSEEEKDNIEAEKLPHGESSRLGRKVKRMEDTNAALVAKLEALTNAIGQTTLAKPIEPGIDDEMPEIITTPEDVQKVIDIRNRQRTKAANDEKNAYFGRFETHRSEDPDMYDDVYQEMLTNHNVKNTGQPSVDADINYLKAKTVVLSRKLAETSKSKPNVLSKTPPAVNIPNVSPVITKQLNLTADEQHAAEVFGFNEEDLKRIFG